MNAVTTYKLRAASAEDLWEMLVAAGTGKPRAYAYDAAGAHLFDAARVRLPWPETEPGEPDPETGEALPVPTGFWFCEVTLVGETDAALAEVAVDVQAASG
jgi:hypothetical protein